jgi:toxin ParE1/3/4
VTIRLTQEADADVVGILRYTRDEFGLQQAAKYRDIILHAFAMIEDDPRRAGSRVLEQFGPQLRQFHLRSAAGRKSGAAHFVVYHVGEAGLGGVTITVVRILHERMDPERHIGEVS